MVCWPTAQLEAAKALYTQQHEAKSFHDGSFQHWSDKRSMDFPFHFADGVSFFLSETELNPDDQFLDEKPRGSFAR